MRWVIRRPSAALRVTRAVRANMASLSRGAWLRRERAETAPVVGVQANEMRHARQIHKPMVLMSSRNSRD